MKKAHRMSVSLLSATVHVLPSLKSLMREHKFAFTLLRASLLKFVESDAELALVLGPIFQHLAFGFRSATTFENHRGGLGCRSNQSPTAHAPNKPDNPMILLLVGCETRRLFKQPAEPARVF